MINKGKMSDDFTETYQRLSREVGTSPDLTPKFKMDGETKTFEFKTWYIYFIIPIVIFTGLFFLKPCFVVSGNYINSRTGEETKKLDYTKMLLYSITLGLILDGAVYSYFFRKCNN